MAVAVLMFTRCCQMPAGLWCGYTDTSWSSKRDLARYSFDSTGRSAPACPADVSSCGSASHAKRSLADCGEDAGFALDLD